MRHSRRQVLKTIGAAGSASVLGVGVATAQEDGCTETLTTIQRTEGTVPIAGASSPVAAGNTTGGLPFPTEPFTIEAGAYAEAGLPEPRITGVMTWNPLDSDPTTAELYLERQTLTGEWQIIGKDAYDPVFVSGEPLTENRLELAAVDGTTFQGNDTTGTEVENPVIIDEEQTYRFVVRVYDGVADFEIEGKVQAFDPECVNTEE
jgi:hypothetical protein